MFRVRWLKTPAFRSSMQKSRIYYPEPDEKVHASDNPWVNSIMWYCSSSGSRWPWVMPYIPSSWKWYRWTTPCSLSSGLRLPWVMPHVHPVGKGAAELYRITHAVEMRTTEWNHWCQLVGEGAAKLRRMTQRMKIGKNHVLRYILHLIHKQTLWREFVPYSRGRMKITKVNTSQIVRVQACDISARTRVNKPALSVPRSRCR